MNGINKSLRQGAFFSVLMAFFIVSCDKTQRPPASIQKQEQQSDSQQVAAQQVQQDKEKGATNQIDLQLSIKLYDNIVSGLNEILTAEINSIVDFNNEHGKEYQAQFEEALEDSGVKSRLREIRYYAEGLPAGQNKTAFLACIDACNDAQAFLDKLQQRRRNEVQDMIDQMHEVSVSIKQLESRLQAASKVAEDMNEQGPQKKTINISAFLSPFSTLN
jgi:hypothetical protein